MKIGIDAISFYTSPYYLDLAELAKARHVDVNKYYTGLGQYRMSIAPPDQDAVTLGANAAKRLLERVGSEKIDTLLFATESGIDHAKAAGVYLHRLLKLPARCSVLELKQACYSATAALHMAIGLIQAKPDRKVLIIASDISRYTFNTPGESSQGCGAVALLITKDPRLLAIAPERGFYTEDVMDFWRPLYCQEALLDGKFSLAMYLKGLENAWQHYQDESGLQFSDHTFHCYHTPVPRLVEKSHLRLAELSQLQLPKNEIQLQVQESLIYSRMVGNCYSAALDISLVSLLDHLSKDFTGARIGFYSYGSGCVAEYFSGVLQPGYQQMLDTEFHKNLIQKRKALDIATYEAWYSQSLPEDGSEYGLPHYTQDNYFRLQGVRDHQRQYEIAAAPVALTKTAAAGTL